MWLQSFSLHLLSTFCRLLIISVTINDKSCFNSHFFHSLFAVNDPKIRWKNIFLSYPLSDFSYLLNSFFICFKAVEVLCLNCYVSLIYLENIHFFGLHLLLFPALQWPQVKYTWLDAFDYFIVISTWQFPYMHTRKTSKQSLYKKAIIPSFYALATKHLFNYTSFTKLFSL